MANFFENNPRGLQQLYLNWIAPAGHVKAGFKREEEAPIDFPVLTRSVWMGIFHWRAENNF